MMIMEQEENKNRKFFFPNLYVNTIYKNENKKTKQNLHYKQKKFNNKTKILNYNILANSLYFNNFKK